MRNKSHSVGRTWEESKEQERLEMGPCKMEGLQQMDGSKGISGKKKGLSKKY